MMLETRDETVVDVTDKDAPQAMTKSVVLLSARPKNLSEFSRTNRWTSDVDMAKAHLGKPARSSTTPS